MKATWRKDALVLPIDVSDPFAWTRIVAAMGWGGDRRRMNWALTTYAAELTATLDDVAAHRPASPNLQLLGEKMGVSVEELVRMPGAIVFYEFYFGKPLEALTRLMHTVFRPAGGFRSVSQAPGSTQLVKEFAEAAMGGAMHAGLLLTLIATFKIHHCDLDPSLNRAIEVLRGWSTRDHMKVPTDRALMAHWAKWRHIAPLWAAAIHVNLGARVDGLSADAASFEALMDPARLRLTLGYAKWFHSFAGSFAPMHASGPLIPAHECLEVVSGVEKIEPGLMRLTPEDVAVDCR